MLLTGIRNTTEGHPHLSLHLSVDELPHINAAVCDTELPLPMLDTRNPVSIVAAHIIIHIELTWEVVTSSDRMDAGPGVSDLNERLSQNPQVIRLNNIQI